MSSWRDLGKGNLFVLSYQQTITDLIKCSLTRQSFSEADREG